MKLNRTLLAVILCALSSPVLSQSQSLSVTRRGDQLRITAPQFHFIQGKALEKLHNGSTITYAITLTAMPEDFRNAAFTLRERFVISFDLWEETYSVIQEGRNGRAVSRLNASMAEAWCLENMPIPIRAVPDHQPFVIKLNCSIDESETEKGNNENSTLTLAGLIDIFSRKRAEVLPRWEASTGLLRLADVKSIEPAP